jgi:hypothetical protein
MDSFPHLIHHPDVVQADDEVWVLLLYDKRQTMNTETIAGVQRRGWVDLKRKIVRVSGVVNSKSDNLVILRKVLKNTVCHTSEAGVRKDISVPKNFGHARVKIFLTVYRQFLKEHAE